MPSNFPSPPSSLVGSSHLGRFGSSTDRDLHKLGGNSTLPSENLQSNGVSLLDTVPNLNRQLEIDLWLQPVRSSANSKSNRIYSYRRCDETNLHSYRTLAQPTPIQGGDLGMHFNSGANDDIDEGDDLDRVRPLEGVSVW